MAPSFTTTQGLAVDFGKHAKHTPQSSTKVVCPGYLHGFLAVFLEDPLGVLAARVDIILSLGSGPQGTSSGELAAPDW